MRIFYYTTNSVQSAAHGNAVYGQQLKLKIQCAPKQSKFLVLLMFC